MGSDYAVGGERSILSESSSRSTDSGSMWDRRLVGRIGLRRIRLHDLRHTHATIAVKAGVPVKVISERLGHDSPAFTLKQYAHVIPGMQAEAATQIAALVDGGGRTVER